MSGLIRCFAAFAAIAEFIWEKAKCHKAPPPLTDILVEYVFELRRTLNAWTQYLYTKIIFAKLFELLGMRNLILSSLNTAL